MTAEEVCRARSWWRSSRSHKRVEYIIRRGCELAPGSNHQPTRLAADRYPLAACEACAGGRWGAMIS